MIRQPRALGVAVVVVSMACLASVATAGGAPDAGTDRPSVGRVRLGQPAAHAPGVPPAASARRVGSVVPEPPLEVRLPSGARVRVVGASSDAEGSLEVPDDIGLAGWWPGGSKLGDPFGSTLVASHVDSSTQGLGPFAELLSVRRGALVRVTTRHLTQVFRVRSLRIVAQGSLSDDTWIFSARGPRRLTLVTCAPPYDRSRGGYQNLAVVVAEPMTEPRARPGVAR